MILEYQKKKCYISVQCGNEIIIILGVVAIAASLIANIIQQYNGNRNNLLLSIVPLQQCCTLLLVTSETVRVIKLAAKTCNKRKSEYWVISCIRLKHCTRFSRLFQNCIYTKDTGFVTLSFRMKYSLWLTLQLWENHKDRCYLSINPPTYGSREEPTWNRNDIIQTYFISFGLLLSGQDNILSRHLIQTTYQSHQEDFFLVRTWFYLIMNTYSSSWTRTRTRTILFHLRTMK